MATCPLCKDFDGEPRSVEAHISGKSDDAHQGMTGREFREEIEEQTSEAEPVLRPDEMAELDGEPTSGEAHSAVPDGEGDDIGAGWAVVGATVMLVLLVAVVSVKQPSGSGGSQSSTSSGGQSLEDIATVA